MRKHMTFPQEPGNIQLLSGINSHYSALTKCLLLVLRRFRIYRASCVAILFSFNFFLHGINAGRVVAQRWRSGTHNGCSNLPRTKRWIHRTVHHSQQITEVMQIDCMPKKIVVEVTLLPVLTKPFHMGTPDINDDVTLGIRQGVQLYRCLCLTSVTANKGSRGQVGSVQIIGHGVRPPAG